MIDVDYARSLVLDDDALSAERRRIAALLETAGIQADRAPSAAGVSVVVATYQGADRIGCLLESLARQTLSADLFETIVIANGKDDGTAEIVTAFGAGHPDMTVRSFRRETAGAGGARNLGLELARREYVTFVDDDDWLEPRFLEGALAEAGEDRVVLSPIVNTYDGKTMDSDTTLNQRITARRGTTFPVTSVPWALGFNACKLVPTAVARLARYREDLASGEDLVYFAHLLAQPGLLMTVPEDLEDAAYVRLMRDDSVSRRAATHDFAVTQRLACMKALRGIELPAGSAAAKALGELSNAQAGFVRRYLDDNPEKFDAVAAEVSDLGLYDFPWQCVNQGKARDLAFLYCFAPFSDTSGVVAAKAIAERGRVTDVISNDMTGVRYKDQAVSALAARYIARQVVVDAPPSFAGWTPVSRYAEQAVSEAEKLAVLSDGYDSMYSRALWIGSHVAAALYKLRHFRIEWTAEFSDPLRRDAAGKPRAGALEENNVSEKLRAGIAAAGFGHIEVDTVFDLVELATFVLADELLFTNENQLAYMLSLYDDPRLVSLVRSKATVRHHPVPPSNAYNVIASTYELPEGVVNIGYFGSFYPSRGIGEVLTAIANLPARDRRQVRLHIFCNKAKEVREAVAAQGLEGNVYVNPYLSYMEFLNATTRFDVLMVNDVQRGDSLPINPFLPSKYSDYLGSGASIWAICDDGSPLSTMPVAYRSEVGNSLSINKTLREIVAGEVIV